MLNEINLKIVNEDDYNFYTKLHDFLLGNEFTLDNNAIDQVIQFLRNPNDENASLQMRELITKYSELPENGDALARLSEEFNFVLNLTDPRSKTYAELHDAINELTLSSEPSEFNQCKDLLAEQQKNILLNILAYIAQYPWQIAFQFFGKGSKCVINDKEVIVPTFVGEIVKQIQKGLQDKTYKQTLYEVLKKGAKSATEDHMTRYKSSQQFAELFTEAKAYEFSCAFGNTDELMETKLSATV